MSGGPLVDRRSFLLQASLPAASLLVGAPLLGGCWSKPTMSVKSATISGASLLGLQLQVMLNVFNNNSFDVQVRQVRVQTTIEKTFHLPLLDYSPGVWLPAGKEQTVGAPLTIPWVMVMPLLQATFSKEEIQYRVKGEADVTATQTFGYKVDRFPLEEEGSVPRDTVLAAARVRFPGVQ